MKERMLFVIDMVNGFVKGGPMADPFICHIIPTIQEIIKEKEGILAEVKEWHNDNSKEFDSFPPHCKKNTWESETCDELKDTLKDSYKFYKNSTSALFAPHVKDFIIEGVKNGVKEIIIMGCCTDICIMNFAIALRNLLDELDLDCEVVIYNDAVETYDAPNHERDKFNELACMFMHQSGIKIKNYQEEKKDNYQYRKTINYENY